MKSTSLFLIVVAISFNVAHAQCPSVTTNSIANYTPLPIDSIVEANGMRNGPDYNGATLYYPTSGGNNFKSIVLVPGFYATQSSVSFWARYLASRGFVAMTIGTNNLQDDPSVRANALVDAVKTMKRENVRTASPVYNKLDTNSVAVGGWSMGGGGAQLAAKLDASIKAVFAIAPYLFTTSLTAADLNHAAPVLIISGQVDNVAPPSQHANVHYSYTPASTNKMIFEVTGGDHYTELYPTTGSSDLGNVVFAWMKLFVSDDTCYCKIVKENSLNQHATASSFQTNINCAGSLSVSDITTDKISIFPNPAYTGINFTDQKLLGSNYEIISITGVVIKKGKLQTKTLNIAELLPGLYFLKLNGQITRFYRH